METVSRDKRTLLFPVLVLGYLETLRQAAFFAFGWAGRGQALSIIALIIVVHQFLDYFHPLRARRRVTGAVTLLYIIGVWYFNRSNGPGEISRLSNFFFGLPDFGLGSISLEYYGAFCFFVVSFYALLVFLVSSYIIEKKSIAEVFFFSVLLLAVVVIVSGDGVMGYAFLNALFSLGLKSHVYILKMETDFRVRRVQGAGLNVRLWSWITVLLLIGILGTASMLPYGKPKIDLAATGNKLAMQVMDSNTVVKTHSGGYEVFWKKMESFDLKGEIKVEDSPVMYIKSPQPFYWRGDTADFYTGKGWKNTLVSRVVKDKEIPNPYSHNVVVDMVEQVFVLAPGVSSQVVFSSGAPARIELPGAEIKTDIGGNLYTAGVKPGVTYKVISYVPEVDVDKLKLSAAHYPPEIRQLYLQLPPDIPGRIGTLAEKLTQNARNPYDKTKVIENFIASNYSYDLTVNSVSGSRDVTDYFLFDLKKGYCTYHSTAMVVMLRSIGIPARWVKGFTTGTLNPDIGVYEVGMDDAHSWVEVYFADYGWITFEPTPSFALSPNSLSGAETAVSVAAGKQESEYKGLSAEEILSREEQVFPWGRVLLFGLVALGIAVVYYLWRTKNIFKIGSGDKVRDIYLALVEMLGRKGYPRKPNQTPLEFAWGLRDKLPEDYSDILNITNAYLTDRYGKRKLTGEEFDEIRTVWEGLVKNWSEKSGD